LFHNSIFDFLLAENLREKGDLTSSTVLSTLQDQIWSLFPSYCSYATDISTSFKLIAKGIGTSLTKRPDLRIYLLAGLRNLISKTNNGNKESSFFRNKLILNSSLLN